MAGEEFPSLDAEPIAPTRDALHAYARLIGGWAATCRRKRKHWWHASLRSSVRGLSTGVIRGPADFELEIDFVGDRLLVRTADSTASEALDGQSSAAIASSIRKELASAGVDTGLSPGDKAISENAHPEYSAAVASELHRATSAVAAALEDFRAGIREETSPIQVWPHHFDLSMIWLPGPKVPGEDPADEENADKQMNFGFTFGDEGIPEPYLYVTAYPLPDALPQVSLPAGTTWRSEGFSGAVLLYKDLVATADPAAYLLDLWNGLLAAGREHLCTDDE